MRDVMVEGALRLPPLPNELRLFLNSRYECLGVSTCDHFFLRQLDQKNAEVFLRNLRDAFEGSEKLIEREPLTVSTLQECDDELIVCSVHQLVRDALFYDRAELLPAIGADAADFVESCTRHENFSAELFR